jgi:hypothetical protein
LNINFVQEEKLHLVLLFSNCGLLNLSLSIFSPNLRVVVSFFIKHALFLFLSLLAFTRWVFRRWRLLLFDIVLQDTNLAQSILVFLNKLTFLFFITLTARRWWLILSTFRALLVGTGLSFLEQWFTVCFAFVYFNSASLLCIFNLCFTFLRGLILFESYIDGAQNDENLDWVEGNYFLRFDLSQLLLLLSDVFKLCGPY